LTEVDGKVVVDHQIHGDDFSELRFLSGTVAHHARGAAGSDTD